MAQPPAPMSAQTSTVSSISEQPAVPKVETVIVTNEAQPSQPPAAPTGQLEANESEHSGGAPGAAAMNPNAFRSVENDKEDAFDAFDGLSLEPTPASYVGGSEANASAETTAPKSTAAPAPTPYHEGQQVLYKNSEGACLATVAKVHYDDELHPYYTINLNGREKQTDNAHLSVPGNESMSMAASNSTDNVHVLLQETTFMLQKLNAQQLMQVKQFIASMGPSPENASAQHNPQMNGATSMGDQPQQTMGMGVNAPPAVGAMPAPTYQSSIPAPSPLGTANAPPSAPAQFAMQQQPNGMQQQPMTMGAGNHVVAAPTSAPVAMPPVHPAQQFSMQQMPQQQPMGMGSNPPALANGGMPPPSSMPQPPQPPQLTTANNGMGASNGLPAAPSPPPPAAAPSPALPPVEKEGNPFDFY